MNEPLILVVEDDPVQRRLVRENLEAHGYPVVEASTRKEALEAVLRRPVDVAVVDYKLGDETGIDVIRDMLAANPLVTPVMVTAYGNIERAVEAVRAGAYDYIVKPLDFEKFLLVLERAAERQKLRKEISVLQERLEEKLSSKNFVFASPLMEEVARLVVRSARSEATVLITGETGTGKDLVARMIHQSSPRGKGPYIALNVPALPETLIESELFGAEKGAFTGAHERKIESSRPPRAGRSSSTRSATSPPRPRSSSCASSRTGSSPVSAPTRPSGPTCGSSPRPTRTSTP
jgi:two-component system NtrC family response regulator